MSENNRDFWASIDDIRRRRNQLNNEYSTNSGQIGDTEAGRNSDVRWVVSSSWARDQLPSLSVNNEDVRSFGGQIRDDSDRPIIGNEFPFTTDSFKDNRAGGGRIGSTIVSSYFQNKEITRESIVNNEGQKNHLVDELKNLITTNPEVRSAFMDLVSNREMSSTNTELRNKSPPTTSAGKRQESLYERREPKVAHVRSEDISYGKKRSVSPPRRLKRRSRSRSRELRRRSRSRSRSRDIGRRRSPERSSSRFTSLTHTESSLRGSSETRRRRSPERESTVKRRRSRSPERNEKLKQIEEVPPLKIEPTHMMVSETTVYPPSHPMVVLRPNLVSPLRPMPATNISWSQPRLPPFPQPSYISQPPDWQRVNPYRLEPIWYERPNVFVPIPQPPIQRNSQVLVEVPIGKSVAATKAKAVFESTQVEKPAAELPKLMKMALERRTNASESSVSSSVKVATTKETTETKRQVDTALSQKQSFKPQPLNQNKQKKPNRNTSNKGKGGISLNLLKNNEQKAKERYSSLQTSNTSSNVIRSLQTSNASSDVVTLRKFRYKLRKKFTFNTCMYCGVRHINSLERLANLMLIDKNTHPADLSAIPPPTTVSFNDSANTSQGDIPEIVEIVDKNESKINVTIVDISEDEEELYEPEEKEKKSEEKEKKSEETLGQTETVTLFEEPDLEELSDQEFVVLEEFNDEMEEVNTEDELKILNSVENETQNKVEEEKVADESAVDEVIAEMEPGDSNLGVLGSVEMDGQEPKDRVDDEDFEEFLGENDFQLINEDTNQMATALIEELMVKEDELESPNSSDIISVIEKEVLKTIEESKAEEILYLEENCLEDKEQSPSEEVLLLRENSVENEDVTVIKEVLTIEEAETNKDHSKSEEIPFLENTTLPDNEEQASITEEIVLNENSLDDVEGTTIKEVSLMEKSAVASEDSSSTCEKNDEENVKGNVEKKLESILVYDHFVAGAFKTAFQLLNSQLAIVNFDYYKWYVMRWELACVTSPEFPTVFRKLDSTSMPTMEDMLRRLQLCYQATTMAQLSRALQLFRALLRDIPLLSVEKKQGQSKAKMLINICRNYILSLLLETERKSVGDDTKACQLAAYATHCVLQSVHKTVSLRIANSFCFKMGNYTTAAIFANAILAEKISPEVAEKTNKMLAICQKYDTDALPLDYDPKRMVAVCAKSLTPIYSKAEEVKCPFCLASYHSKHNHSLCAVCCLSQIGHAASGMKLHLNNTVK